MKPPPNAMLTVGRGAAVVFLHGTGTDKTSWRLLMALLRERVRGTAYDRRGSASWPVADGDRSPLVHEHADDAADVIESLGTVPVHVCAVSFGAVVALELMKRRPEMVSSAVLFEPALSTDEGMGTASRQLAADVERSIAEDAPALAAQQFYRRALGDDAWPRLPADVRQDMSSREQQILHDLRANAAYRPDYAGFRQIGMPVLLLRGGRSRLVFEASIRALCNVLPRSQRGLIGTAGHIPGGGAWQEFADALAAFLRV